jgi:steroid delta-isomerase-like uncharacterized protein
MRHNMLLSISGSILVVSAIACAQPTEQPWGQAAEQPREQAMTTALDRHEQAVRAFNAQDAGAVADLYAVEAVLHDPQQPEPIPGRDAIREAYAQMFRTFPDAQVTISNRHVEGNLMMYELRLTGTNKGPILTPDGEIPATGERIDVPGAVFADLDADGRFRDTRRYYDVATMMRQLGLDRPDES